VKRVWSSHLGLVFGVGGEALLLFDTNARNRIFLMEDFRIGGFCERILCRKQQKVLETDCGALLWEAVRAVSIRNLSENRGQGAALTKRSDFWAASLPPLLRLHLPEAIGSFKNWLPSFRTSNVQEVRYNFSADAILQVNFYDQFLKLVLVLCVSLLFVASVSFLSHMTPGFSPPHLRQSILFLVGAGGRRAGSVFCFLVAYRCVTSVLFGRGSVSGSSPWGPPWVLWGLGVVLGAQG